MKSTTTKHQFNKNDWVYWGRWVQPPLSGLFWCYWGRTKSLKELTGLELLGDMIILDGHFFYRKYDETLAHDFMSTVLESPITINRFIKKFDIISQKYINKHLAVLKSTRASLPQYVTRLFSTYQEIISPWTLSLFFEEVIQDYIFEHKLAFSIEEIFSKSAGLKRTWLEQQPFEVRKFAHILQQRNSCLTPKEVTLDFLAQYPDILRAIKRHVANFSWFGTHHWWGEPYNISKCIHQIQEALKKKEFKLTREIGKESHPIWRLISCVRYWRTHYPEVAAKVVYRSRGMLTVCAKNFGLDYNTFIYLSHNEILNLIASSKSDVVLPCGLQERKNAYGCYIDRNKQGKIVTSRILRNLQGSMLDKKKRNDISEVRGMVASQGKKAIGFVKVLISPKDFFNFKKGDVLVAPETTPDFVPCMKLVEYGQLKPLFDNY